MGCGCGGSSRRPTRRPRATQRFQAKKVGGVRQTNNPNVPRRPKQVKAKTKASTTHPQSETSIMKHREKIKKLREKAIMNKLGRR